MVYGMSLGATAADADEEEGEGVGAGVGTRLVPVGERVSSRIWHGVGSVKCVNWPWIAVLYCGRC